MSQDKNKLLKRNLAIFFIDQLIFLKKIACRLIISFEVNCINHTVIDTQSNMDQST